MNEQNIQQNNPQNQQNNPQNDQSGQNTNQQDFQFQFHVFMYPMPGTQEGDNATTPGVFFFTPFFMPQQAKPHASESAMKKLPIVIITKEHVNSHASCPICLEPFSLPEDNTTETNQHEPVRQMPCNHMFCESCLFQWLRQNNSCPLCRNEIEAEVTEAQQQEANVTNIPFFGMVNIPNLTPTTNSNSNSSPSPNSNPIPNSNPSSNSNSSENVNSNVDSNANSNSPTRRPTISCALASVGCCEEIDNDGQTPIITLPQCHHRFHASCLRTSLLVEGYPPDDFNLISRPLNFHCPTCRAPAIVQSDMLKMSPVLQGEQREQQSIPFSLPLTVHIPDSDDMDLD